jgi:hypothetical protein
MPPKTGKEVGDPFAGLDGSSSAAQDAASLHGTQLGAVQSIRVTRIPLYEIQPDPLQPRRIVPNELRTLFQGDAPGFLREWINTAEIEPMPYFGEGFEIPSYEHPVQTSLQQVLLLARSIKDTGLTNPITVIRSGRSTYTLETGERRWFAFQLLHTLFGDEFSDIPARVMNERSVWRQASENNQRDDLNAIAKARQYALLMMDVMMSKGDKIESIENFDSEREYYAQIAAAPFPYGFMDKIQNAMGFSSRASVTRHRQLLGLADEIWILADDYNCPESVLRQLLGRSVEEQIAGFEEWLKVRSKNETVTNGYSLEEKEDVTNGYKLEEESVTTGNTLEEGNVSNGSNSPENEVVEKFKQYNKQLSQLFSIDAQSLTKKKRQEYRQSISNLRRLLDNLEARLKD